MSTIAPSDLRAVRPAPTNSRHYLVCPPANFRVDYAINPWMDPARPVDTGVAMIQWQGLVDAYRRAGHHVDVIESHPDLPDMVFAANAGTVIGGTVYLARFRHEQRRGEQTLYGDWFRRHGFEVVEGRAINEGEGDFALADDVLLAGHGFRTELAAHAEAADIFGLDVVSLELVDPAYYHLDTALTVLDPQTVAYLPEAFAPTSQGVLAELFPDAVLADPEDAARFALNATSDGDTVFLPAGSPSFEARLAERGFEVVPVELSELLKSGGSVKCCTLELRR